MTASPPPAVSWQSPEPEAGPAPGVTFAPHGPRLVAYILDSLILAVILIPIFLVSTGFMLSDATIVHDRLTALGPNAALGFLLMFIGLLIALLYFPFFWATGGETPGMRPFGLRVVRDADGSRIGWGTAFLRTLGFWIAGAVFYIGFIWIFIDRRRRGWQDLIAGTVVVKEA